MSMLDRLFGGGETNNDCCDVRIEEIDADDNGEEA
jgi:hypothetical protein